MTHSEPVLTVIKGCHATVCTKLNASENKKIVPSCALACKHGARSTTVALAVGIKRRSGIDAFHKALGCILTH